MSWDRIDVVRLVSRGTRRAPTRYAVALVDDSRRTGRSGGQALSCFGSFASRSEAKLAAAQVAMVIRLVSALVALGGAS